MGINALVVVRADFAIKVIQKSRWRFVSFCHKVEEIESSKYAISLWDVTAEAIAAALLPANDGVMLHHQRGDIFKAHSRFVDGNIKYFPQLRNHLSRR